MSDGRIRVALIFGGVSSEHDVSCLTAGGVVRAIDPDRFVVIAVGITPAGRWVQVPFDEVASMDVVDDTLPRLDESRPSAVLLTGEDAPAIATRSGDRLTDIQPFDVAFSLLHGPFGEDGAIQGLFEMHQIRYVGAGIAASAIGMDKHLMKTALAAAGFQVSPWETVTATEWQADPQRFQRRVEDNLTFPVYVKPARGGSSVGISRVSAVADLGSAIEEARRWDPRIIVEEGFVDARELEVAVLDTPDQGAPRLSVAGEIRVHTPGAFYDYAAKYTPEEQVSLDVPADISEALLARIQRLSGRAFRALSLEGLARVDTFVTADEEVVINEVNTMPGFTPLSMYPLLWEASGLSYPDLLAELIDLALHRPVGLR
ncbi:MAG: D-alanine--D-alanine ligase family protein [Propioniciclava sp.]